jgi:hypothetical protein
LIAAFYKPCGKTYEEQHKAAYELLYAAASFLDLSAGKVEKDENGKPFFPDAPSVFFSIAHADGMAAVAIGSSKCGIDVEGKRKVSERIRKKFLNGANEDEALLRWTERESYGKYEAYFDLPMIYRFERTVDWAYRIQIVMRESSKCKLKERKVEVYYE